jgi:hypothetical protein
MKLRVQTAMVGLATTAMLFGYSCSNPPSDETGTAGTGSQQGSAGTSSAAGTTAAGGTTGTAGTGAAGTSAAAGTNGTAGTGTAGTGTAGTGSAGTGAAGTGAGTAGTGATTCPAGVKGHCNAETGAVNKYPGFTLKLAEEFDSPIDLDKDPIWTWSDGGPPEGQARFHKSQITFANGTMIITATKPAGGVPSSISYAEPDKNQQSGMPGARAVLSGEFRTKYNNYRYGRYEVRYKAPIENGTMPASSYGNFLSTMFTFRTPKWSKWRELDLELEANIKNKVAYNVVNADNAGGYPGGDSGNLAPANVPNYSCQDMHTYAIEWTPTKVTWYVDGVALRSNLNTAPGIPVISAKIMMNLWVFGGNGDVPFGNTTRNVYPFFATYEWFRFYKWDQETTYPYENWQDIPKADTDFSRNNPLETNYPAPN